MTPRLSIVILTLNEQRNIADCLAALARQTCTDFETIIVDAASRDDTVAIARRMATALAGPTRIHASDIHLPIGAARNLGVRLATAPCIAFVSADAELGPDWVERALAGLEEADMVFARQVHAPRRRTTAAVVRGMRYAFPAVTVSDPERLASNVAAAFRRPVLERFPFDDHCDAAEDLLLARDATEAGFAAVYDPGLVVWHHDVETPRQELRKAVREGTGWGRYRRRLGLHRGWLVWGAALAASLLVRRGRFAVFAAVLWAPAMRRALRTHTTHLRAILVAPFYDLVFLGSYVRALLRRRA